VSTGGCNGVAEIAKSAKWAECSALPVFHRGFSRENGFSGGKGGNWTQKPVKIPKGGASAPDPSGTVKPCFTLEFQGFQRP